MTGFPYPSRRGRTALRSFLAAATFAALAAAPRAAAQPGVSPMARDLLQQASAYFKSAGQAVFEAEVHYDEVLPSGRKVQYSALLVSALKRPDSFRTELRGDIVASEVYFDGEQFTLYDAARGSYGVWETRVVTDDLIESVEEKLGVVPPLPDLLYSDFYEAVRERMTEGSYLGVHSVGDRPCHHLLFSHEDVDWQVWIQQGPRPLLRKILITFKTEPQAPQFAARFTRWDFSPHLTPYAFTFRPPPGAREVEFMPVSEIEEVRERGGRK